MDDTNDPDLKAVAAVDKAVGFPFLVSERFPGQMIHHHKGADDAMTEAEYTELIKRLDEKAMERAKEAGVPFRSDLTVDPSFPPGMKEALELSKRMDLTDQKERAKEASRKLGEKLSEVLSIDHWSKEIRMELGHPVIAVELDNEQLECAILMALRWREGVRTKESESGTWSRGRPSLHEARRYASAMAKQMLGHIRSKYGTVPMGEGGEAIVMDGSALLDQARIEFEALGAGPWG